MVTERVYVVHIFGLAQMQRNCNNNDLSIKKIYNPKFDEGSTIAPTPPEEFGYPL